MRDGRRWLTLAYALATVLAQGGHDHGERDRPSARAGIACGEPRTHVESHPRAGDDRRLDHCLSCQYRAQSQLGALPQPRPGLVQAAFTPDLSRPEARPPAIGRPSCRAPPRA